MGQYLPTPCTLVEVEEYIGENIEFAVGGMQGWRVSMEDAHIGVVGVKESGPLKVRDTALFAVFDGHGGKDVALFVENCFEDVLISQDEYKVGQYEEALRKAFHKIDDLLEDEANDNILKTYRKVPNPKAYPSDYNPEISIEKLQRGIRYFKKQVRRLGMKDDPLGIFQRSGSIVVPASDVAPRGESTPLSSANASPSGELAENTIAITESSEATNALGAALGAIDEDDDDEDDFNNNDGDDNLTIDSLAGEAAIRTNGQEDISSEKGTLSVSFDGFSELAEQIKASISIDSSYEIESARSRSLTELPTELPVEPVEAPTAAAVNEEEKSHASSYADSAADEPEAPLVEQPVDGRQEEDAPTNLSPVFIPGPDNVVVVTQLPLPPSTTTRRAPAARPPTVCRLSNHRLNAGCTAIVALKVENSLYVANAGDSRAVLCRADGSAFDLSIDHKPTDDRELDRIEAAGGFVNGFGRINGNLNLSRSLGDLKYKQNRALPPAEQIITAEPDIVRYDLQADDRFLILGCDGIWDCLTSQKACDLVRERLDSGMSPSEIVPIILEGILGRDTILSKGIGTDNMTLMIVKLKQNSRS